MRCKNSVNAAITSFVFLFAGCTNNKSNIKAKNKNLQENHLKYNYLTEQEKQNGWKLLFDGESLNGWKGVNPTTDKDVNWKVNDGILSPVNDKMHQDLITKEQFNNFELSLEFKFFKGTNSGIKYLVTNNFSESEGTYLGFEYQILDKANVKYDERGEYRTLGSLYDLIGVNNEDINLSDQWHHARILVNQDSVEHWLDGDKIIEYDKDSAKFRSMVAKSKYKIYEGFGTSDAGHILLQNEGTPVSFRNIKIKSGS